MEPVVLLTSLPALAFAIFLVMTLRQILRVLLRITTQLEEIQTTLETRR